MKKPSKKTQKNKADRLWSETIHIRDNEQCRYCGSKSAVNAHHIIGRTGLHLRFDLRNGILLCSKHHTMGNQSAHQNPIWFGDFLDATIPDIVDYLRSEQNKLEPNFNYEECIAGLKKSLDLLKNI